MGYPFGPSTHAGRGLSKFGVPHDSDPEGPLPNRRAREGGNEGRKGRPAGVREGPHRHPGAASPPHAQGRHPPRPPTGRSHSPSRGGRDRFLDLPVRFRLVDSLRASHGPDDPRRQLVAGRRHRGEEIPRATGTLGPHSLRRTTDPVTTKAPDSLRSANWRHNPDIDSETRRSRPSVPPPSARHCRAH